MTQLAPKRAFDRRLLHRAQGAAKFIGICAALGVARTACVIAGAWLTASLIAAAFAGGRDLDALMPQLIALAAVLAARALLASVQESAAHRAGAGVKSGLRRQALEQLMRLPSEDRHSGETAALLVRGIDALDDYFARYLPQLVLAAVVPISVLVVMLVAYPPAALIVLVTLPLIPLFGVLIGLYTRSRAERQWASTSHLAHHFADLVAGLPTLKAFGRAARQIASIKVTTGAYRRRSMALLRVAFCSALVLELAASLSVALVAVTVGVRLIEGGLTGETGLQHRAARPDPRARGLPAAAQRRGALPRQRRGPGRRREDLRDPERDRPNTKGPARPPPPRSGPQAPRRPRSRPLRCCARRSAGPPRSCSAAPCSPIRAASRSRN